MTKKKLRLKDSAFIGIVNVALGLLAVHVEWLPSELGWLIPLGLIAIILGKQRV